MKKICLLIFVGIFMVCSCKKDDPQPKTSTTTPPPSVQTADLDVYLGDPVLITYFGGNPPMIKITETGTSNEVIFLVNTCSDMNGNSFTVENGKTYSVSFGVVIGGTWAQHSGFTGTITVANDGLISGTIGSGMETLSVAKATDYGGCGTVIQGSIMLFF
jgi:hypothetical protein